MIVIIRGHIRNAFNTHHLKFFVHQIYSIYPNLHIYIHTWSIYSSNTSWRTIEQNDKIVTKDDIYKYFKGFEYLIKHIIIDDDTNIKLIGNLKGNICNTCCPIIGWKKYLCGKYKIVDYLKKNNLPLNEPIINFRFDLFDNSFTFKKKQIINFINNFANMNFKKNKFMFNHEERGIDNIYIGNLSTMHKLLYKLHHDLDKIIENNDEIINQEFLFFRTNEILFKT